MPDEFEQAIREAKLAAGLDPDVPQLPSLFHEYIPEQLRARFWSKLVARAVAASPARYYDPDGNHDAAAV